MTLKRTPDAVLRFPPTVDFRYARTVLLDVVNQTGMALVADLPSERLEGHDSPLDPLIMAQPDPTLPGEGLMSVIERRTIPAGTKWLDLHDTLVTATAHTLGQHLPASKQG